MNKPIQVAFFFYQSALVLSEEQGHEIKWGDFALNFSLASVEKTKDPFLKLPHET